MYLYIYAHIFIRIIALLTIFCAFTPPLPLYKPCPTPSLARVPAGGGWRHNHLKLSLHFTTNSQLTLLCLCHKERATAAIMPPQTAQREGFRRTDASGFGGGITNTTLVYYILNVQYYCPHHHLQCMSGVADQQIHKEFNRRCRRA